MVVAKVRWDNMRLGEAKLVLASQASDAASRRSCSFTIHLNEMHNFALSPRLILSGGPGSHGRTHLLSCLRYERDNDDLATQCVDCAASSVHEWRGADATLNALAYAAI